MLLCSKCARVVQVGSQHCPFCERGPAGGLRGLLTAVSMPLVLAACYGLPSEPTYPPCSLGLPGPCDDGSGGDTALDAPSTGSGEEEAGSGSGE